MNGQNCSCVKKNNSSSRRRFFRKAFGRRFFRKLFERTFFRKNNLCSTGRTICVNGRTFFRKAFWKKVLPVERFFRYHKLFFRKKVLPVTQIVLSKEGSSNTNCFFGRRFFRSNPNCSSRRRIIFFNARTILLIHLINGCTSNVAGCT